MYGRDMVIWLAALAGTLAPHAALAAAAVIASGFAIATATHMILAPAAHTAGRR